ncbi:MAG: hypothetical protein HQK51_13115 [Oligoflexia bacterium]|nr:hypothetical protein [Oligoflexia bacterium]
MIDGIYNHFKFHPIIHLLITLLAIIPILVGFNECMWVPWFIFALLEFFYAGLKARIFINVFLLSLTLSASVLILSILYPAPNFMIGEKISIFGYEIHKYVLDMAIINFKRLFLLSIISINSSFVIGLDRLILYLSTKKSEYVPFCYSILVAINAITLLKEEKERIDIVARFRGVPRRKRLITLFPLLVFAVKHSQRAAMAMLARGINKNKVYYFDYSLNAADKKIFFAVIISYVVHLLYYLCIGYRADSFLNEMSFSIWKLVA